MKGTPCETPDNGKVPRFKRLYTVHEAAAVLGCNRNHVYYLLNMGRIEGFKVRWIHRISGGSLEAYKAGRDAKRGEP